MMIEEYPGAVSQDLCEQIIARFEQDPHLTASAVVGEGGIKANDVRSGTMLKLDPAIEEWNALFMAVVPALRSTMDSYMVKYPGLNAVVEWEGLDCTIPQIERVDPGQGFNWHYDLTQNTDPRVLAGLLYLRTITEGGYTEFAHQDQKIQPEAGKIVLFPPFWTHIHRGVTPARVSKYVMSFFWVYRRAPD